MLRSIEHYNNLSPQLRKQLNELRASVGRHVKYKFYISQRNPDGNHVAAPEFLYPALYSLTPTTYKIMDPGDQLFKDVALADNKIRHGAIEEMHFRRVRLMERDRGILSLDLSKQEDVEIFEYLEMHPKNENGLFRDKDRPALFTRVDELREAKTKLKTRELRVTALMVSSKMSEPEIRDFAAAMNWNELDDLDVLREKVMEIAEKSPEFFKKFIDDPKMESKAVIRRAMDANVIAFIPVENKFIWTANGATIAMLERTEDGAYIDSLADWFMSHKNGLDTYKKIKGQLTTKQPA